MTKTRTVFKPAPAKRDFVTVNGQEAIKRFEEAVRSDTMRGAQPPEEWEEIETELREAREDLTWLMGGTYGQRPRRPFDASSS